MFGFFFTKGPVNCFEDATKADTAKFGRFHRGMLERGIYLAPSAYEVRSPHLSCMALACKWLELADNHEGTVSCGSTLEQCKPDDVSMVDTDFIGIGCS